MFAGKTLLQILSMGGFTMYVLLACSILSLGVIIDRLISYGKKSRARRAPFMDRIKDELKRKDMERALEICRDTDAPFARVVQAGLEKAGRTEKLVTGVMERQIAIEEGKLERLTSIVGTIGNIAVYIGLFGTVLGIIRAFRDISAAGAGGMDVVIAGVAEALITTATGLAVAVPSVVLYNYFSRRVERFVDDMELAASEAADLLGR
ncbi:MAG TPA: MotA/TolQ/ExbB proton channel family protein [Spirochaetia bacterium]|nr:MotA/TolQ/ExbB proton channel family protein [Spirochaetia bacterium]